MTSSFTYATPEDGAVIAFARDFWLGNLPTTVEFKLEWLMVCDVATPTVADLDRALETRGPGTARHLDATATSDTFTVAKVMIEPLSLVHSILNPPLLTPVNA